ncbi:MAG: hypothetical protein IJQ43_01265 [Oscillospiraceae bacterium]|nr:hypothetical protein [Oscillospiraceae bacterium]
MKKYLRFAENYILLLASLTLGLYLLFFAPKDGGVSDTEMRMLQSFPQISLSSLASGTFMDEFESFLSDAFPAREEMIALSDALRGVFGRADAGEEAKRLFDEEEGLVGDEAPQASADAPEPAAPAAEEREETAPAAAARGASLWRERADGKRDEIETYSPERVAYLASVLDKYRAALPEDGNIFFINVPASDVLNPVYDDHRFASWGDDLAEAVQPLVASGVHIYDPAEVLRPYENDGPLFSNGDYHWYVKTAWRTSNAFLADLGYAPSGFYDYRYYLRYSLKNGPYTPEQLQSMTLERENLMVPLILSPVKTSLIENLTERTPSDVYDFRHTGYTMYLGGAKGPYRLFETGFHTGRSALVISDSYAFSMMYYLFPYYDQILATDLRGANYGKGNIGASIREYMAEYEVDDVYLVSCHWTSINGTVFGWRLEHFLDAAPPGNGGDRDE